jgi:hypothetical protein
MKSDTRRLEQQEDAAESSVSLNHRLEKVERALRELSVSSGHRQDNPVAEHDNLHINTPFDDATNSTGLAERLQVIEARIGGLMLNRANTTDTGLKPYTAPGAFPASRLFWPFGSSYDIDSLRPSVTQVRILWPTFLRGVDQVVKVLHRPSTERILQTSVSKPGALSRGQQALLFAVCYSAIPSMMPATVEVCFRTTKDQALAAYRSVTETALWKADFLTTHDLPTLQALVLFLGSSCFTEDAKAVWPLTGLARRLSTGGTAELSPFEREMHKRLWWQLWYLDHRAAEDKGNAASSTDADLDPDLPLNVHDSDLDPRMPLAPAPRTGWTEMSFSLVRFEIAIVYQDNMAAGEKKRLVEHCQQRTYNLYLMHCDTADPIHWLAQHVSHVLITEIWLRLYGEESLSGGQQTEAIRDQLFLTAIDIVDIPRRLRQEPQGDQWKWLLKGYFQFLPMAFLLTELSRRSQNFESLDYAWEVAEHAFSGWTDEDKDSRSGRILRELMARAKANREQQMLIWQSSDISFRDLSNNPWMAEFSAASSEGACQGESPW